VEIINENTHVWPDGSLAITVLGDFVGQAIYWTVVSHDLMGVLPDAEPKGSLTYGVTFVGADKRSLNYYRAPHIGNNTVKYKEGRLYGAGYGYGQLFVVSAGDCERVFVRSGDA
jgi:hypothetical protein